jgi:hypothetical protein
MERERTTRLQNAIWIFGSVRSFILNERNEGIDREGRAAQEGEKKEICIEREGEKEKYMDM